MDDELSKFVDKEFRRVIGRHTYIAGVREVHFTEGYSLVGNMYLDAEVNHRTWTPKWRNPFSSTKQAGRKNIFTLDNMVLCNHTSLSLPEAAKNMYDLTINSALLSVSQTIPLAFLEFIDGNHQPLFDQLYTFYCEPYKALARKSSQLNPYDIPEEVVRLQKLIQNGARTISENDRIMLGLRGYGVALNDMSEADKADLEKIAGDINTRLKSKLGGEYSFRYDFITKWSATDFAKHLTFFTIHEVLVGLRMDGTATPIYRMRFFEDIEEGVLLLVKPLDKKYGKVLYDVALQRNQSNIGYDSNIL